MTEVFGDNEKSPDSPGGAAERQVSLPMTPDEDDVLCKEFKLRSNIFLQKGKTSDANRRKARAWEEIARCVNAVNPTCTRSTSQLQNRLKYLTSKAKDKAAASSKRKRGTGGGKPAPEVRSAEQEILAVYQDSPSWSGLSNARESIIGASPPLRKRQKGTTEETEFRSCDLLLQIPPIEPQQAPKAASSGLLAAAGEPSLQRPPASSAVSSTPRPSPASTSDLRQVQIEALQAQIRASNAQAQLAEKKVDMIDEMKEAVVKIKEAAVATKDAMISMKSYFDNRGGTYSQF